MALRVLAGSRPQGPPDGGILQVALAGGAEVCEQTSTFNILFCPFFHFSFLVVFLVHRLTSSDQLYFAEFLRASSSALY